MSSRPISTGHKDYLEATSLQKSAIIEGYERQDGRTVSPLTWKDGEYVFSITWPGVEDEDAGDDRALQAWREKAQRLDLNAIVCRSLERIMGKDGTPLHHLLEAWQAEPPPDLYRPCVAPHTCEALGKWLVIQLSRAFAAAMALAED
jgi:hypothetical protein